jgi:hypothetical protein
MGRLGHRRLDVAGILVAAGALRTRVARTAARRWMAAVVAVSSLTA